MRSMSVVFTPGITEVARYVGLRVSACEPRRLFPSSHILIAGIAGDCNVKTTSCYAPFKPDLSSKISDRWILRVIPVGQSPEVISNLEIVDRNPWIICLMRPRGNVGCCQPHQPQTRGLPSQLRQLPLTRCQLHTRFQIA